MTTFRKIPVTTLKDLPKLKVTVPKVIIVSKQEGFGGPFSAIDAENTASRYIDTAETSESLSKVINKVLTDNLSVSDIISVVTTQANTITDTPRPTDSKQISFNKSISEITSITELISITSFPVFSEIVTISDVITLQVNKGVSDSTALYESYSNQIISGIFILREDGFRMMREDGSYFLREGDSTIYIDNSSVSELVFAHPNSTKLETMSVQDLLVTSVSKSIVPDSIISSDIISKSLTKSIVESITTTDSVTF